MVISISPPRPASLRRRRCERWWKRAGFRSSGHATARPTYLEKFPRDKQAAARSLAFPMSTPRPFLYLKPGCPWCDEAEDYLQERGIAYGRADVNAERAAFDEKKRLS